MPENPPEPGPPGESVDRPAAEPHGDAVDDAARQSLDIPEWVSELRRLYVEPKTRAEVRQSRGVVPHRRKLGLPKGRGSGPAPSAHPVPEPQGDAPSPLEAIASGVHPDLPRPPELPPEPLGAGSQVPPPSDVEAPSGSTEDAAPATWLVSYLAATGHRAEPDEAVPSVSAAATEPDVAAAAPSEMTEPDDAEAAASPATTEPGAELGAPGAGRATTASLTPVGEQVPSSGAPAIEGATTTAQQTAPEALAGPDTGGPEPLSFESTDAHPVSSADAGPAALDAARASAEEPRPVSAAAAAERSRDEDPHLPTGELEQPQQLSPNTAAEAAADQGSEAGLEPEPDRARAGHPTLAELAGMAAAVGEGTTPAADAARDTELVRRPDTADELDAVHGPGTAGGPVSDEPGAGESHSSGTPVAVQPAPEGAVDAQIHHMPPGPQDEGPAQATTQEHAVPASAEPEPTSGDEPPAPTATDDDVSAEPVPPEAVPLEAVAGEQVEETPAVPAQGQEAPGDGLPAPTATGDDVSAEPVPPEAVPLEAVVVEQVEETPAVPPPAEPEAADQVPQQQVDAPVLRSSRSRGRHTPQPRETVPEARDQLETGAGAGLQQEQTPDRPSTAPRVTLSWRQAESFDIGLPSVDDDDDQQAIVVEPPSQLVARPRRRRPEPTMDEDDEYWDEPPAVDPEPVAPLVEEVPRVEAAEVEGATSGSSRTRWVVLGVALLVVLAVLAWYFLLRGGNDGAAAPQHGHPRVVASGGSSAPAGKPLS